MQPESCIIIGLLFYCLTVAINRFFGERNFKILTSEEKVKLTESFSKHRSLATYIPIGIMLAVLAIGYLSHSAFVVAFPIGVVAVLVVSLSLQFSILRRLRELSLPAEYIMRFRTQSIIVQIGSIVALSMFTYGIVG